MLIITSPPKAGDARRWSFRPERYGAPASVADRAQREASVAAFFERYRMQLLGHTQGDTYVLEIAR
jgi:hypothetical protein